MVYVNEHGGLLLRSVNNWGLVSLHGSESLRNWWLFISPVIPRVACNPESCQAPAAGPCSGPDEFGTHPRELFLYDPFTTAPSSAYSCVSLPFMLCSVFRSCIRSFQARNIFGYGDHVTKYSSAVFHPKCTLALQYFCFCVCNDTSAISVIL